MRVDDAPPPAPGFDPRNIPVFGPLTTGTMADIAGGVLNGLDYITRAGRAAFGAALPGEGEVPVVGGAGPTEATQADDFLPAAVRMVADRVLDLTVNNEAVMLAMSAKAAVAGEEPPVRLSFTQQAIKQRADGLIERGANEEDAVRLASYEEAYNRMGAVGAVVGGLVLGVPATLAAIPGTAVRVFDPEGFAEMERRANARLKPGSPGGIAVEFAIPELGVVSAAAKAFQFSRLRLGAGLRASANATDMTESVRLRLEALDQYQDDLDVLDRMNAEKISQRIGAPETAAQADQNKVLKEAVAAKETEAAAPPSEPIFTAAERSARDVAADQMQRDLQAARNVLKAKIGKTPADDLETALRQGVKPEEVAALYGLSIDEVNSIADPVAWIRYYNRGGPAPSSATAKTAADAAPPAVDPETRILNAEIAAERLRVGSEITSLSPDVPPPLIDDVDEDAIMDGIRAAVEMLPEGERVSVSVGSALDRATRAAKASMFRAIRQAVAGGETFRLMNVTVGVDSANKALRVRRMVGTFDTAVQNIDNALRAAGKSDEDRQILLAPFLRARAVAAETLTAIDQHNIALRNAVTLAKKDRATALKEVRLARKNEEKARLKTEQATKKESRTAERVTEQSMKDKAKTEKVVDTLQERIEKQRARLETERIVVAKVGGDEIPMVGQKSDLAGYPNQEDIAFLESVGVTNIYSWDPQTVKAMAEWVRANPIKAREVVHWEQITREVMELTGADLAKIEKGLPKTSQMTKAFYVMNQLYGEKLRSWRELGIAVRDGRATEEMMTEATVELMRIQNTLREGIGEVGRTLGAQRILKKSDAIEILRETQVVNARYADVEKIAKRIEALEGKIQEARAAGDSEALADLRAQLASAAAESDAAFVALDDAKRLVNEAADRNLRAALDLAAKRAATPEQLKVLALYDANDLAALSMALRRLEPAGLGAFIQRGLIAGRFGKVPSQIQNLIDTGMMSAQRELIVRPLAGMAARVPGVGARALSKSTEPLFVSGETKAAWTALVASQPDAAKFFARTIWQGHADDIGMRHGVADYETLVGQGVAETQPFFRIAGRDIDVTGPKWLPYDATLRMLYGADGFWRIQLTEAEAAARSMREAVAAGDPAAAARAFIEATRPVRTVARESGLVTTYNKPFAATGWDAALDKILGAKNYGGFQPMRLFLPAARWGKRYVELGIQLSGGGLISGTAKARRAASAASEFERVSLGREAAMEQAAGAVGAVQLAIGFTLVGAGIISGPLPTNESERRRWAMMGKTPMSILVGDRWVPLGWFGALGAPYAMAAMISGVAEEQSDEALHDRVGRAAHGMGTWVIDQPAMYAGRQLLDGIWASVQYKNIDGLTRMAANAFKPGAAAQSASESFTAVFDRYQRDPEGFLQLLAAKLPGASMLVPPKINPVTGQPEERRVTGTAAFVQPEYDPSGQVKKMSQVEAAIVEVGAGISSMERTMRSGDASFELTQDEYVKIQKRAGELAYKAAEKVVGNKAYQASDQRTKENKIERIYTDAKEMAREEMARSMLASAQTPEDTYRALVAARGRIPSEQYVASVRRAFAQGRLTEEAMKRLDDTRTSSMASMAEMMGSRRGR